MGFCTSTTGKRACCPSCGEYAGQFFKGSGTATTDYLCLKCGKTQNAANYYICSKCNGIFCIKCPFNNSKAKSSESEESAEFADDTNKYSCPACAAKIAEFFKGSGKNRATFTCLKCGRNEVNTNYYKCEKCNGIFCRKCHKFKSAQLAQCPACSEPVGKSLKGSNLQKSNYTCQKCGTKKTASCYYKCEKCNGIFCYECPFEN